MALSSLQRLQAYTQAYKDIPTMPFICDRSCMCENECLSLQLFVRAMKRIDLAWALSGHWDETALSRRGIPLPFTISINRNILLAVWAARCSVDSRTSTSYCSAKKARQRWRGFSDRKIQICIHLSAANRCKKILVRLRKRALLSKTFIISSIKAKGNIASFTLSSQTFNELKNIDVVAVGRKIF